MRADRNPYPFHSPEAAMFRRTVTHSTALGAFWYAYQKEREATLRRKRREREARLAVCGLLPATMLLLFVIATGGL